MRKVLIAVLLAMVAMPVFAAMPVVRSWYSGVSFETDGVFRFSVEGLLLPSTAPLNGGFRAVSTSQGSAIVYPLFLRGRAGVLSLEAGVGYGVENRSFEIYAIPAFSLSFGTVGVMIGIPVTYGGDGFLVGIETALTLN